MLTRLKGAEHYVPHSLCVTFILCLLGYTKRVIGDSNTAYPNCLEIERETDSCYTSTIIIFFSVVLARYVF